MIGTILYIGKELKRKTLSGMGKLIVLILNLIEKITA